MAGVQGLPFIISANRASRTQTTLPSSARPDDGLFEKLLLLLAGIGGFVGQHAEGPAKCRQDFFGMANGEEVDGGGVLTFDESDFQLLHEAG